MGLPVFDTQFEVRLTKKIAHTMDEISETVTTGMCPDHGEYRYECGRIEGLRLAHEYMNEARHELLGGSEKEAA